MNKSGKLLIIDDDEDILFSARLLLKQHYSIVRIEKDPGQIPSLLKSEHYDVILLDMNFSGDATSGTEGFIWLKKILATDPSAVVVLITAYGNIEMAVKAIKEGATDFALKPWQNEKLLATISSAMKLSESKQEIEELLSKQKQLTNDLDSQFQEIIGVSDEMRRVFSTIQKVAATDANVLIVGENGTGKELVARAIHRQSPRREQIFLGVDVGSLSESLFESELFGYVRGAFTDAKEDRAGRFETASGGTLFLDEIGNLTQNLQVKLLAVLQNRQVTRLGANIPRQIDIRLLCATNLPMEELKSERRFRQDLLYRVNTVEVQLPPLRNRREDIPLLTDHFLKMYTRKYNKPMKQVSTEAMNKLSSYNWPGNVRELQHTIERVVILSDSDTLTPSELYLSSGEAGPENIPLNTFQLDEAEKLLIIKAVSKHDGNLTRAAKELGITRAALYRRLEKYGL
ncbi:MAG: sigma-54 dependent transcriptional regulator [Bacteroidetes bacterium]|nr:sigma-54 dependent transcriptional regulator [Bacteroidota bacterium]MCL5034389.1 sigma-54 dependent transcriptional regulator [Bacteroidota bacterium]